MAAFRTFLATILSWDFDRVIVGHGDVIDFDGKAKLRAALVAADLCDDHSAKP